MNRSISFKSTPLSLLGRTITIGMPAPRFQAVSLDLNELTLPGSDDKAKVITSFPSIDTPVCDLQVKEFNKRASKLSAGVSLTAISMDLPFAQKRFCDLNSITNLQVVSDYRFSSFGINYGLLIKELHLLARAVLIADKNNIVRYIEVVAELTQAPNYDAALEALEDILKNPFTQEAGKADLHCVPCLTGVAALPEEKIKSLLSGLNNWELVDGKKIRKKFLFKNFSQGKTFVDLIASIAGQQGHHPQLTLTYTSVTVSLSTHAGAGLTENDFIMAGIIDGIEGEA